MVLAGNLTIFSLCRLCKGKEVLLFQEQVTMLHQIPPLWRGRKGGCKSWSGILQALLTVGEPGRIFTSQEQVQHGTPPQGPSAAVNPKGDGAPSTCDGQGSQTHSWGCCLWQPLALPFQSNMGNKRILQLGGPQLQGRGSPGEFSVRPKWDRIGENCSGDGKQAFPQGRGKEKRVLETHNPEMEQIPRNPSSRQWRALPVDGQTEQNTLGSYYRWHVSLKAITSPPGKEYWLTHLEFLVDVKDFLVQELLILKYLGDSTQNAMFKFYLYLCFYGSSVGSWV